MIFPNLNGYAKFPGDLLDFSRNKMDKNTLKIGGEIIENISNYGICWWAKESLNFILHALISHTKQINCIQNGKHNKNKHFPSKSVDRFFSNAFKSLA